jgi:hypothetical protein
VYKVGEKVVWSGDEGGFTEVEVIAGALPVTRTGAKPGRACATFRELSVLGSVESRWLSRKLSGYRDVMVTELNREEAVRWETAGGLPPLSTEAVLAEAPEPLRSAWPGAVSRAAAALRSREAEDLKGARKALEALPPFGPALYYLGRLDEAEGDDRSAAVRFERALERMPGFPEALAARSWHRALEGSWPEAKALASRAVALLPDLAEGHLVLARIALEEGGAEDARLRALLARRLAPPLSEIQAHAQSLANVAKGPAWPRSSAHESAHYLVRSELPESKVRVYAEHLEAMRGVYQEVLGRALPGGGKARVLVFGSEEGYQDYMEFSLGGRQEHTLGVYSPWHGQMTLYEEGDAEETLRVLAHEGFHQALHRTAPQVPIWLNEGLAEYVGAAKVEQGKVVDRSGLQPGRLRDLRQGIRFGWESVPFAQLMNQPKSEFYGRHTPFKYAQAWSMIHFFMNDADRGRPLFQAYLSRILDGERPEEVFASTFGRTDLAALEEGWRKFHELPAAVPAAASAEPGTAAPGAPPAPPATPPTPEPVTLEELKLRLASKDLPDREEAVSRLGERRSKESRRLLIDLLLNKGERAVRVPVVRALSKHRHSQTIDAFEKALRTYATDPELMEKLLEALQALDMCEAIHVLIKASELEGGRYGASAISRVASIGCVEACVPLAHLLERAEAERRKPARLPTGRPNPSLNFGLASLVGPASQALAVVSGGARPKPGETWNQLAKQLASNQKLRAVHLCESTGQEFEVPIGKNPRCPSQGEGKPPAHEDPFLRHR